MKEIRSFLGHARSYLRLIKNFSKIFRSLCNLLTKDVAFVFDDECLKAFEQLKAKLTSAPIIQLPNWEETVEITCDASDYAIRAILGQRVNILPHVSIMLVEL